MSQQTVANCPNPKCNKPIFSDHQYSWCTKCGDPLPKNIQDLLPRLRQISAEAAATKVDLGIATQDDKLAALQSDSAKSRSPFVKRYLDLYRASRLLVALGTTVKTIGIVAAIIIFLFWFIVGIAAASETSSSPFAAQSSAGAVSFFVSTIIGVIFGALVGGLFFLLGVLISAQGQLLMAHADSAVHTSPFLSDEERAAAMSLPYTAPTTAGTAAG